MVAGGLAGRRIVVPESRELDLFVSMLERHGAAAIRCPLVTILDVEEAGPVERWLGRLAAGEHDDLVLFTGEGVKRLIGVARRAGMETEVTAALAKVRKIVRGPKPTRALRELGLAPEVTAAVPTTEGLLATLAAFDLAGRTVGLQGYPGQGEELDLYLAGRGARVDRVLPYRYASDEEDERVAAVIRLMTAEPVDLIAFTSRPQVLRLVEVAERRALQAELATAMTRVRIAAVGPVTAAAVEAQGWRVSVAPDESFHLKPFIASMAALLAA